MVTMPTTGGLSLAEVAYRAIRDQIVMLTIRPGAPIKEDLLAAGLGTGRTPIREALKRLETDRLVVTYPRRGTFATEVHITDLTHVSEVRRELEPLAAQLAATRATGGDRERLGELAAEVARLTDGSPASMALDVSVHRAIYTATHNPFLEDTLIGYDNLATRIWCLFTDRLPDLTDHVAEHSALLEAIVARQPERAAELAAGHVTHFDQAIRRVL
jgi:DNA-binding GntR family transcriptional regulator